MIDYIPDTAEFTREQAEAEYASFVRSPDWELRNIERALTLMPFLNTSDQLARLWAVRTIKRERKDRKKAARA